ncbi:MAG: isoprenylcysteine carboxylmethyltransferase family protein [Stygiobacter sp.]
MENFLKIFLPVYFVVYFGIAFIGRTLITAKKIGKNPFVLQKDDRAYGLIGLYLRLLMVTMFLYVIAYPFLSEWYGIFLSIKLLNIEIVKYAGIGFLTFSFIWTVIAQKQMRESWRIGIDFQTKTELIISGLFNISRNPIFLGMIAVLIGLFLLTPNVFTIFFLLFGYVLIQIQVRLEEEHLLNINGDIYREYCGKVRRWI